MWYSDVYIFACFSRNHGTKFGKDKILKKEIVKTTRVGFPSFHQVPMTYIHKKRKTFDSIGIRGISKFEVPTSF